MGQTNLASDVTTPEPQNGDVCVTAGVEPSSQQNAQILDPGGLGWEKPETEDAPTAWTPSSGIESDHDSAIYAEIEKNNEDQKMPSVPPPRTLPNGEGPPGYSLHLAAMDKNEDVYTHV